MNSGDENWVKVFGYVDKPASEAYAIALQWALSQFAGGMDEVTAQNINERSFNIVCFILAFVMGATFIGNLTSSMTQLHILGSHKNAELSLLRQFLSQNQVSRVLMLRVQRNAQHAIEEDLRHMEEERVSLLFRVSEPLRIEIHFEMYAHLLQTHDFLSGYIAMYPQVMRRVCHFAMSLADLSPGDIVFNAGENPSPPRMYVVVEGELNYKSVFEYDETIEKGQCIAEGTLWTSWIHMGTLVAKCPVRICKLDSAEFRKIVTRFQHDGSDFNPCRYASTFVEALQQPDQLLTDISKDNARTFRSGRRVTLR